MARLPKLRRCSLEPGCASATAACRSPATCCRCFISYGDPPDDQGVRFHPRRGRFASRSLVHDWLIRAHRHRNLFQVLLIERGGGEMTFEAATLDFTAPAAILVAPTTAHGFRFRAGVTDGWVVSFTEDVAAALGERSGEAIKRAQSCSPPNRSFRWERRRGDEAAGDALHRTARGKLPGTRGLPPGDARPAGFDCHRGGAARGLPRGRIPASVTLGAGGRHRRGAAPSGRGAFPERTP